jgi:AcrR family transcriptional regulator
MKKDSRVGKKSTQGSAKRHNPASSHAFATSQPRTGAPRMTRPDDARALRSRDALKGALLRLIERCSFEQISIRDITAEAGVSYPVFFRRYATKEELLGDIAAQQVQTLLGLTSSIVKPRSAEPSSRIICEFVQSHRKLWTTLLTTGATSIMRSEFIRIAKELAHSRGRVNPWLPVDLASAFVVSGIFEILSWWLQQPENYPIDNIVTFIDVLVVRSTARPVKVRLPQTP